MEINSKNNIINIYHNPQSDNAEHNAAASPSFKAAGITGALNSSGYIMNGIENGGFLTSFLIQDFCGMTVPRSVAGFLRDKEVTGEYNVQEGFEVLGREGLTGPMMMAVAPLGLLAAAKFGKSTSVNSELIKRYGNSLKEMISEQNFDETLLKNPEKFKQEFYKKNVEKILKDTLGKENFSQESVEYILKQLNNIENIPKDAKLKKFRGKARYKSECFNNIKQYINELKYSTGSDLEILGRIKLGNSSTDNLKVFDTIKTFDGMTKYAEDAITANKKLEHLNEVMAESIKCKALGKRVLTTIALVASTLGVLSVLPKIYARSNTAPGARKQNPENQEITKQNENPAFKGKNKTIIEAIGKSVDKNKSDFVSSQLEYNGHNFTETLMAGLSLFGLLTPRGLRAYNRAQVDEDGKKDLTELWEILLRDVTSSLAVIFVVPMATRACVTSYENKSGFVLMNKDRTKTGLKTKLDLLNPYSKAHVLTNTELTALYDGINSKEKMLNFCKFINNNGGDLEKIISKSENYKSLFNAQTLDLNSLKGLTKEEKNKRITSFIENIEEHTKKLTNSDKVEKKNIDSMIEKVMKTATKGGKNKIATFARGLNSVPALLTTFIISPYILGWAIPRLTYRNTRRIHEKEDREREQRNSQKLKIDV